MKTLYKNLMVVAGLLLSAAATAQVKVGDNPTVMAPNTIFHIEKGTANTVVTNSGSVGIGTTAPSSKLEINSGASGTSGLKFSQINSSTTATAGSPLGVDANGNVVVVSGGGSTVGLLDIANSASALGTSQVSIAAGTTADITGATVTISPTVNVRVLITTSALPLPASASSPVQGSIDLVQNGVKIASQYYSSTDAPSGLVKLGNYSTITRIVDLTPGTYTFKLQAKGWFNTTLFNLDPVPVPYAGSIASDSNSMKASITVLSYTR